MQRAFRNFRDAEHGVPVGAGIREPLAIISHSQTTQSRILIIPFMVLIGMPIVESAIFRFRFLEEHNAIRGPFPFPVRFIRKLIG